MRHAAGVSDREKAIIVSAKVGMRIPLPWRRDILEFRGDQGRPC
jgi:hypothetical protein